MVRISHLVFVIGISVVIGLPLEIIQNEESFTTEAVFKVDEKESTTIEVIFLLK